MTRPRVIAGVCVLLVLGCAGLLVPLVQRVREAAARAKCNCHIGCLARAVHSYAQVNGSITGAVPLPLVPADRRLSWVVPVLPYMEAGSVFERFDLALPADDARNRVAATHPLQLMICPSSTGPGEANPGPVTHYVGAAGVGADAAGLPDHHPRAGPFGYNRKTTLNHQTFVDGVANTLLLVETAHGPASWAVGGMGTVRAFVPGVVPYIGDGRPFGGWHTEGFWRNRGLMSVVMADCSFHTLRDTIDPAVLEALATANGREALPAEW